MNIKTLNLNVNLNQGTDFNLVLLINGDDGNPLDITGYSFAGDMKVSTDSTVEPVASFTFSVLNQTTNKGQVSWTLPNATTESLMTSIVSASIDGFRSPTPYLYDILMTDNDMQKARIVQGLILVSPAVTGES